MDTRLSKLISDYQSAVEQAVALMNASGIPRPGSDMDWIALDIPYTGELNGKVAYFKHGAGCGVHLPHRAVDFDFGAAGEIDGFDPGRLGVFASTRLYEYGFASENEVARVFDAALEAGTIRYSGNVVYYLADKA